MSNFYAPQMGSGQMGSGQMGNHGQMGATTVTSTLQDSFIWKYKLPIILGGGIVLLFFTQYGKDLLKSFK